MRVRLLSGFLAVVVCGALVAAAAAAAGRSAGMLSGSHPSVAAGNVTGPRSLPTNASRHAVTEARSPLSTSRHDDALKPPRSRLMRVTDASVFSTGRYTYFTPAGNGARGVVVDELTGARVRIPGPGSGCGPEVAGGGNLGAWCDNGTVEFLRLPAGSWRSVPVTPYCLADQFGGGPTGGCGLAGVGSDWFSVVGTCYHCAEQTYYQSIATGQAPAFAPVDNAAVDLDYPTLEHPLCAPLTVEAGATVTFDGRYLIQQHGYAGRMQIDQCGRHQPLLTVASGQLVGARPHLVLWDVGDKAIRGMCLPSHRLISIPAPPGSDGFFATELTLRHIYVLSSSLFGAHTLWRTTWPRC